MSIPTQTADQADLCRSLAELLGADRVLTDEATLASRGHDFWLLDFQKRVHGTTGPKPLCVVQPRSQEEVVKVLTFAGSHNLAVVPYGAGSGVCGGARARDGSLVLDLSLMNKIVAVNDTALTVTVQPGMLGGEFEQTLNSLGYSMGHFPQSMNLSSVGGWVATRASGQFSTKYGSIENMLVALKAVLADGTVVETRDVPRRSVGPSVNEILLGSEGTLAVVTEITYKIHPLPEKQDGNSYRFADFGAGLEAVRKIMRAGWKPALLRLYDGSESRRHFGGMAGGGCILLLLSEGPAALVEAEQKACAEIIEAEGGVSRGAGPLEHWLKTRFQIPDLEDLARNKGVVFDTIEVAANWDRVYGLYKDVVAALASVPGIANASAHSSHSYEQGTCLYFTFAVKKPRWLVRLIARTLTLGAYDGFTKPEDADEVVRLYNQCWQRVMEATLANGGTISHHHGVGQVRMPWLERELGSSYQVLKLVKRSLDRDGVLNPGTLFPDEEGE